MQAVILWKRSWGTRLFEFVRSSFFLRLATCCLALKEIYFAFCGRCRTTAEKLWRDCSCSTTIEMDTSRNMKWGKSWKTAASHWLTNNLKGVRRVLIFWISWSVLHTRNSSELLFQSRLKSCAFVFRVCRKYDHQYRGLINYKDFLLQFGIIADERTRQNVDSPALSSK